MLRKRVLEDSFQTCQIMLTTVMAELPRIPIEAKLRPLDLKDRLLHHGVFERMILGGSLGVPAISLMSICQVYRSGKQPALMVRFMAAKVWNMWTYEHVRRMEAVGFARRTIGKMLPAALYTRQTTYPPYQSGRYRRVFIVEMRDVDASTPHHEHIEWLVKMASLLVGITVTVHIASVPYSIVARADMTAFLYRCVDVH